VIVFTQGALGLEYKIGVQVKLHEGEHDDTRALDQVVQAKNMHHIDAAVVLTIASRVSKAFDERRETIEKELHLDVRVILLDGFLDLIMQYLRRTAS
jgi:hypothetical protein